MDYMDKFERRVTNRFIENYRNKMRTERRINLFDNPEIRKFCEVTRDDTSSYASEGNKEK